MATGWTYIPMRRGFVHLAPSWTGLRIPRKVATSPRQTGPRTPRHGGQSEASDAGFEFLL